MSAWKVILATLVIFTAGLIAGGVAARHWRKPFKAPSRPFVAQPLPPEMMREGFVHHLAAELKLDPQQKDRILKTVRESQERIRELYSLIGPEVGEEMQYVRESIRAELTPEQQRGYDEFMRKRQRRLAETKRSEGPGARPQAGPFPKDGRGRPPSSEGPPLQPVPRNGGPRERPAPRVSETPAQPAEPQK